jgi:hypothetical protein
VLVEGGREDEAWDVFCVVVGCYESHFWNFVFCNYWLSRKLSKAKALVVGSNSVMHWGNWFLMRTARIHCLPHLIHLIYDLFYLDIAHWFSINCIF